MNEKVEPEPGSPEFEPHNGRYLELTEEMRRAGVMLGGFYLLDCADLDEALGWAKRIPAAEHGSIEVRPIMPLSGSD